MHAYHDDMQRYLPEGLTPTTDGSRFLAHALGQSLAHGLKKDPRAFGKFPGYGPYAAVDSTRVSDQYIQIEPRALLQPMRQQLVGHRQRHRGEKAAVGQTVDDLLRREPARVFQLAVVQSDVWR